MADRVGVVGVHKRAEHDLDRQGITRYAFSLAVQV
jgi:hypothetical protein